MKSPATTLSARKSATTCWSCSRASFPTTSPRARIKNTILLRLSQLEDKLRSSNFFRYHELIGSSLLFVYDERGNAGVWMIDFGKTSPSDKPLRHDVPWRLGTREDGYLIGLDNLTTLISDC